MWDILAVTARTGCENKCAFLQQFQAYCNFRHNLQSTFIHYIHVHTELVYSKHYVNAKILSEKKFLHSAHAL